MGFRCPKCHIDMGKDKDRLNEHMKACTGVSMDRFESFDIDMIAKEQAQVVVLESSVKQIMKEAKQDIEGGESDG